MTEPKQWQLVQIAYVHCPHKALWGVIKSTCGDRRDFWFCRLHLVVKRTPGYVTEFLRRCKERCSS